MTQRTLLLPLLAALAAVGASGCFVSVDDGGGGGGRDYLATYEPCVADSECLPADFCEPVTVTISGRTVSDAICTHDCYDDLDCPRGVISGLVGACVDFGDGPVCYERCDYDSDCPSGFYCIDCANGWCGDPICLPN